MSEQAVENKELIRNGISMLGQSLVSLGLVEQSPCSNTGASYSNDVFSIHAESWAEECKNAPPVFDPPECDYCKAWHDAECEWDVTHCSCAGEPEEEPCDNRTCLYCSPNFIHFKSGLSANWYKHVNRCFEPDSSGLDAKEILRIFAECMESLNANI